MNWYDVVNILYWNNAKAKQFACYFIQLHRCFVIKIQLNFRCNIHTIHTHTSIHRQYHYFLHLLVIKCILTKSKMCALFVCQLGYEYNSIKKRKKTNITDYSCCISSMTRKGSQKPNVVVVMYLKWFAHLTNDVTATQIWLLWLIR